MSKQIQDDDEFSCDGLLQLQLALGFSSSDHRRQKATAAATTAATKSGSSLEPTLKLSLSNDTKPHPGPTTAGIGRGASSPRSTVSSLSVANYCTRQLHVIKREKVEGGRAGEEEEEVERASSRGPIAAGDEDDDGGTARKKLRLTKEQSALLEDRFKEHSTLNPKQKQALAKQLNLRSRQVEVWFQNRRARTKLKQTEMDCEFLKRCCETLTEENRWLQKELQELKAAKFADTGPPPAMHTQIPAATRLTMCPSCERITAAAVGEKQKSGGAPPLLVAAKSHSFNPFTHPAAC